MDAEMENVLDYSYETSERESAPEQEPPSLIVGRDNENHWVVVETRGLCGGIFASEAAAVRYARDESGGRPGAVRFTSSLVAFDLNSASR
jgi:hypothetical protein